MTHVIHREQRGEVAAKLDELAASVYPEVGKTLPQARWKSFDSVDRWRIIEALIERISYDHPAAQLIWLTPLWFRAPLPNPHEPACLSCAAWRTGSILGVDRIVFGRSFGAELAAIDGMRGRAATSVASARWI